MRPHAESGRGWHAMLVPVAHHHECRASTQYYSQRLMHAAAGGCRSEVVDCMQFRAQVCGSLSSLGSKSVRCDVLNVVYSASKKTTSFHSRVSTLDYCSHLLVSFCCSFYRTKSKQSFLKKSSVVCETV